MRQTRDYDFHLPAELIAQRPAEVRHESRLLVVGDEGVSDQVFRDIVELLPEDGVLVVNDTKVIRARLHLRKESGGAVELLLIEPAAAERQWRCLAKASKAIRVDMPLLGQGGEVLARVVEGRGPDGSVVVEFADEVFGILEAHGELPLPPYIERPEGDNASDRERYQTVYARESGAVAAPTAGLHFSDELLDRIQERGITLARVTLHVGLGTFAPVRVDDLDEIELHEERYSIPQKTADLVASGRPVVAVGTTVVRTLEAAASAAKQVRAGEGRTSIFISPGYQFRAVDHLITNFHLPASTLLMLVSAFAGYQRTRSAYEHAVREGYRFYSYGDAMFLTRATEDTTC